eukprot:Gregarina_sp_Poly_1__10054@NODE_676_length_6827_cov_240_110355_g509_i0_p4_GENE_NODE_676_length_6827_cov_240_110355_g509_i0NODE_676_length_6827_cov_240_110355_g509_i0_p4_ORF_typecomplete_len323_score35_30Myosin_tail_1/PF01576_19/8_2e05Myosin_tail_1/PF01576_19/0_28FapA/PF03961_13/3_5e06Filament/PF00038_21/4_6e05Filament/PF00038_21/20Leu_zip/PF15294_6/8_6e05ATG16/PF08614_11/0_00031DUF2353/PF09789_9/0_00071HAP1_N/PF04849_13/0_00077KASH_CCD/PF14662_6/0_00091DUF1664/PF07889_12/0_00094DUF4686/PF15742_5
MPTSPPCPRRLDSSQTHSVESMSHVPKGNVIPLSALEWLPTDAEEQLSLAFRIIGNAYKSKVSTLDAENRQLRSQLDELKNQISNFQKKQSATEVELIDARQRINNYKDENIQLLAALRKLQEKIERFENVRKAVLSSIQDHTGIEEDDKYLLSEAYLGACAPLTYQDITHDVSKDPFTRYTRDTVQAYHVPAQNGTTTASPANQTNSYGAHSATTNSSALMSPAHTQHGQLNTPQTNDTQLTSGGGAEGKHFFRLVKQRIEYDRFQAFIAMVRRLNTKQQTREETLAQVRQILGDHLDLIDTFTQLISRPVNTAIPHAEPC